MNQRQTHNKSQIDLRMLAKSALSSIEKKLRGIHRTSRDRVEKEVSTSNLVQMLIQEATDNANLASHGLFRVHIVSDFLAFVGENVSRLGTVALMRLMRCLIYLTNRQRRGRLAVVYTLFETFCDRVSCFVQLPSKLF